MVTTSDAACLHCMVHGHRTRLGHTTVLGGATATALGTGTLTLNDDPAVNQDACKGATITVTVGSN